jgi:hypothetical protein
MDFYVLNPTATEEEAAAALNVHPHTVHLVKNSDLWQARFAQRREAFINKADALSLERLQGKVLKLAETGVDVLTQRIEAERVNLGLTCEGVRETTDMALKALGYGVKAPPAKVVNNTQNIVISSGELAEARRRMRLQMEHEHGERLVEVTPALSAAAGL